MRVQAQMGAPMRAWVGLGLHLWVHFWCKQMHALVSFPPRTAPLGGCARMSPFPTSPMLNEAARPQGKPAAAKAPGCPTPAAGPRLFPTRCRSKDVLPKNELGFATRSLGHWDLPGSVRCLSLCPLRSPCPLHRHLLHLFPLPSSQGEHPPLPATQGQDSGLVF